MFNILGSVALVYLASTGVVTNASVVGRGLVRAVRHAAAGDYRGAGVEAMAALAAPALMSYASTCALVMDVVDAAYQLTEPTMQETDVMQMPQDHAA